MIDQRDDKRVAAAILEIELQRRQEAEAESDLAAVVLETLRGSVWHTTNIERYKGILSEGAILPEPPIPDSDRWGSGLGTIGCPYVRSIGGVSLFDFLDFDAEEYSNKYPISTWREFVPYRSAWGEAIWIEVDVSQVIAGFISGCEILDRWKADQATNRFMPPIEAAHERKVEGMAAPEFVALRALMGDAWVEANILSEKAEHPLGRWYRKADGNPWVQYTDQLVERLMGSDRLAFDQAALARKLAAEFVPTLAEIEVAVHLLEQGFDLVMEPTAPAKGPDVRADIGGKSYFVEVRAVSDSEDDERFNAVSSEVFARLNEIPSRYTVKVTVGDDCIAGSGDLKKAIDQIVNALSVMKEKNWEHARLFHSAVGSILDPGTGLSAKEKEMAAKAEIIAEFHDSGKEQEKTVASAWRPYRSAPEPDQTHERLKKMLSKKKTQLPENSRGILVFDVSELFMLSDFSIESALYGDLVVRLTAPSAPGGPIDEPTLFRNGRGFFGKSSRVSAVVFHTRHSTDGKMENRWRVFPTNRANEDTIQLGEGELALFGDLEERKNLSAENLPEALIPSSGETTQS